MKESRLFLDFVRRNFILLFGPVFLGLLISFYIYSEQPAQNKLSQSFKFEYNLENIGSSLALAEQAATELRLRGFDSNFPDSKAVIYKGAPLTITIDVFSLDRGSGYALLLKETEYLRQNFSVSTLTEPKTSIVEPDILKFLLAGLLPGFFIGLTVSLCKEYLQKY